MNTIVNTQYHEHNQVEYDDGHNSFPVNPMFFLDPLLKYWRERLSYQMEQMFKTHLAGKHSGYVWVWEWYQGSHRASLHQRHVFLKCDVSRLQIEIPQIFNVLSGKNLLWTMYVVRHFSRRSKFQTCVSMRCIVNPGERKRRGGRRGGREGAAACIWEPWEIWLQLQHPAHDNYDYNSTPKVWSGNPFLLSSSLFWSDLTTWTRFSSKL